MHEYYELGLRIEKDIQVWTVGNTSCSKQPYGTFSDRRQEGLLKAVEQKNNLFADWARMTLGWWTRVEVEQIQVAIDRVNRGEERDPLRMVSLVGMFCRFADQPQFPAEIRQSLADCILISTFTPANWPTVKRTGLSFVPANFSPGSVSLTGCSHRMGKTVIGTQARAPGWRWIGY